MDSRVMELRVGQWLPVFEECPFVQKILAKNRFCSVICLYKCAYIFKKLRDDHDSQIYTSSPP